MHVAEGDSWLEWSGPPDRRRVLVFHRWHPRFAQELADKRPSEVVLFNGNEWGDFSYLHPLKDSLLTLEVAAAEDYSGLMPLRALERLVLRAAPRRLGMFDLAAFSHLLEVDLCWYPKYRLPLFVGPRLRALRLYDAPVQSVAELGPSSTLEALQLDNSRKLSSLEGVQQLPKLRELRVGPCLTTLDISAVGACKQLKQLRIVSRRDVVHMHELAHLRQVERVEIDADATYTFSSFKSLTALRSLSARGEWADDAVSALLALPQLKSVTLQPSREGTTALAKRIGLPAVASRHGFEMSLRGGVRGLLVLERV